MNVHLGNGDYKYIGLGLTNIEMWLGWQRTVRRE